MLAPNMETVVVGIGKTKEVSLKSNPSTGYSWRVVGVPDCVSVTCGGSRISDDAVGAASEQVFVVEGLAAGTGTLTFEYRQGPMGDPAESKSFLVRAG